MFSLLPTRIESHPLGLPFTFLIFLKFHFLGFQANLRRQESIMAGFLVPVKKFFCISNFWAEKVACLFSDDWIIFIFPIHSANIPRKPNLVLDFHPFLTLFFDIPALYFLLAFCLRRESSTSIVCRLPTRRFE